MKEFTDAQNAIQRAVEILKAKETEIDQRGAALKADFDARLVASTADLRRNAQQWQSQFAQASEQAKKYQDDLLIVTNARDQALEKVTRMEKSIIKRDARIESLENELVGMKAKAAQELVTA